MKNHKFADIFPLMNSKEFKELKKDIETNGLLEPIVLFEGKILDGRNRNNACRELLIKPTFRNYKGKNPLQYVMSTNLKRRNLTDSQKAIIGVRYLKALKYKKVVTSNHKRNRDIVSEQVGVSGSYIQIAKQVLEEKPEMESKIMRGDIKLKQVYRNIKIEKQEQEIKKLKRITGAYDVIVIDPPWPYSEKYDPIGRRGACPYPMMEIPKIHDIRLPAAKNCVLWLWTTHRFIWDARQLMNDWGFDYKCILVWDKEKMGLGMWLRMQCEFCLIGIKGKPIWKLSNQRDIIREARTTHSTKPECFYKFVDGICVGKKLDYFARKKRKGWDVYGDEVK